MATKINTTLVTLGRKVVTVAASQTETQARAALFLVSLSILALGLSAEVTAQQAAINYNDDRINNPVNGVMADVEGLPGALVMLVAGLGAIEATVLNRYRAALFLMGIAVVWFMTRVFIGANIFVPICEKWPWLGWLSFGSLSFGEWVALIAPLLALGAGLGASMAALLRRDRTAYLLLVVVVMATVVAIRFVRPTIEEAYLNDIQEEGETYEEE